MKMMLIGVGRIFLNVLSLSLSGALIGMLILLIHPLTEKVFRKNWNYYIWFLVIVRLLLPVQFGPAFLRGIDIGSQFVRTEAVSTEVMKNLLGNEGRETKKDAADNETSEAEKNAAGNGNVETMQDVAGISSVFPVQNVFDHGDSAGKTETGILPMLLLGIGKIWFLGAVFALFIKLWNYRLFIARLKQDSIPVTDSRIMKMLQELSARLSIGKIPAIYESVSVFSPITVGLWNPIVILPKEERDMVQYRMILHHELVHVARRDLWGKWLWQILLCIHWFNPIFYLINRRMNIACELSCDEAVLADLTNEDRKVYGNVLLNMAQKNAVYVKSEFSTTLMTQKSDLERRLNGILNYKKQTALRWLISTCVLIGMLFLVACSNVDISSSESYDEGNRGDSSTSDLEKEEDYEEFTVGEDQVNESGEAWQAYEDDSLLAKEDVCDLWQAVNYKGGGNDVTVSKFALNGSDSVRIAYADEDTDVKIDSSFQLLKGKFKIVHIAPDGSVLTINDTGEGINRTVTMKKGRNVIKMVGQGAKLKELEIKFSGFNESKFENVYYTEDEEYVDKFIMEEMKEGTIKKEKVMEVLSLMDERTASQAFSILVLQAAKQRENFTTDELHEIFAYSDADSSVHWLEVSVSCGGHEPLSADAVFEFMPYMKRTLGKRDLMKVLSKEEFFEGLKGCIPYLNSEELEICLLDYFESGGSMSPSQFAEIKEYLEESTIEKLDEFLP